MEKQVVEYPCRWSYRIIGKNEVLMRIAVEECMQEEQYQLIASHTSRSGKYISLNLETVVLNEKDRDRIYMDLKSMECIKMVL